MTNTEIAAPGVILSGNPMIHKVKSAMRDSSFLSFDIGPRFMLLPTEQIAHAMLQNPNKRATANLLGQNVLRKD